MTTHSFSRPNKLYQVLIILAVLVLMTVVMITVFNQSPHDNQLKDLVDRYIHQSGVTNPVTSVLLNFRAYDTFIEFVVFLCVSIAVLPYIPEKSDKQLSLNAESNLLQICKTFIPVTIIVAGYLLWIGSSKPGGAFQAAALLAGCLVLISLANAANLNFYNLLTRMILSSGIVAFLAVSVYTILSGSGLLEMPYEYAGGFILLIEFCATFAVAISLFLCFESIHRGHL